MRSRLYLVEGVGGPSRIRSVPLLKGKAGPAVVVPTPAVSSVGALAPLPGDDVAFVAVSYTTRHTWYRVGAKDGAVTKTALATDAPPGFADVNVAREECVSKDGTKVPLTVLRSKAAPTDGTAPAPP